MKHYNDQSFMLQALYTETMNRVIRVGSLIVGIAVMLSISTVSPALAANKINEINETFIFEDSGLEFCGDDNVSVFNIFTARVTEWDNNMLKFHLESRAMWTDEDTGKVVAVATATFNLDITKSELPVSSQENIMGHCTGNESFDNVHFGFTVQKDGTTVFRGTQ